MVINRTSYSSRLPDIVPGKSHMGSDEFSPYLASKMVAKHMEHCQRRKQLQFLQFLVALFSPGIGYDTSTNLLLHDLPNKARWPRLSHLLCKKLARWDAIYFAKIAERGYLFEQEWAFSRVFAWLVGMLVQGRLQFYRLFISMIVKELKR